MGFRKLPEEQDLNQYWTRIRMGERKSAATEWNLIAFVDADARTEPHSLLLVVFASLSVPDNDIAHVRLVSSLGIQSHVSLCSEYYREI